MSCWGCMAGPYSVPSCSLPARHQHSPPQLHPSTTSPSQTTTVVYVLQYNPVLPPPAVLLLQAKRCSCCCCKPFRPGSSTLPVWSQAPPPHKGCVHPCPHDSCSVRALLCAAFDNNFYTKRPSHLCMSPLLLLLQALPPRILHTACL
jgi:hypothetical protein